MAGHAPTAGAVLAIVGGVFILLAGLVFAFIGALFAAFLGLSSLYFDLGLVVGLLTIVFGVLALVKPEMKTIWGALVIVMAVVSLPTALGGFIIGFILALIGGILILTFKPPMMVPVAAPMMMGQPMAGQPVGAPMPVNCPACGGAINPQTRTCTACGRMV